VGLRGRPIVLTENPSNALPPANRAGRSLLDSALDQIIRESLVIALAMVVRGQFVQRLTEVPFAERHDAVQAVLRKK
jgi:hypothetical protein